MANSDRLVFPESRASRPNLAALTGLRFIAALDVVLFHFARVPLPNWAAPVKNIVDSGYVGVNLFFLLSGFIMAYSYLAPDGKLRGTPRNFYVSRFARIFPAYLLGFVLAAPTDIFISLHANKFGTAIAKLFVNGFVVLTFLQAWTPFTAWAWNFPAWSVSVEAFFYLLFPWLGPRLSRIRFSSWLLVATGLWFFSLLVPTMLYLLEGPTGPPQVGQYLQMAAEFTPLLRLPEFAIGILIGRAFVEGRFDRFRSRSLSPLVAFCVLAAMALSPYLSHSFVAGGLFTPLFVLLIVTLAQEKGPLVRLLSLPFMILLGEASYGIYILQIPVSFVLRCPPPHTDARVLLVYCLALICVALLSFRFIESPLRTRLKEWLTDSKDLTYQQSVVSTPSTERIALKGKALKDAKQTSRRSMIVGSSAAIAVTTAYSAARFLRSDERMGSILPDEAIWISTTESSPWQTVPLSSSDSFWATHDLTVYLDSPAQTVEGFGGCFNELGWTSLTTLRSDDQQSIFRELFAPGVGANFTLCRTPIGANDFSRNWYSYDEVAGDFALGHFSISNDLETQIPFIKSALHYNPHLRFWASPWSPPTWMKKNGFYAEKPQPFDRPPNGIRPDQVGIEGSDMFLDKKPYYAAYASYFGNFVDAYRQHGINIDMVMPQNEFNTPHPFPSCTWTPESLARFLRYLGPVMSQRGVEIFFGTLERADPALLETALRDPEARKYIRGVGAQWDGKSALPSIHKSHPDLRIYQSEQECGDGTNSWHHCLHCWDLMKFYFENGTNAYMYWNLALHEGGESRWGWRQNSLITVDVSARTYHFNHEFYLMKHFSHFVQPGARRLRTKGLFVEALAFLNPDKSVAVVLHHGFNFKRPVNIMVGDRRVSGWLKANSFNTFLLKSPSSG